MKMKESELKAMISLLDDDELTIQIEEKIMSLGTEIIPTLESVWESNFDAKLQERIEDITHRLQFQLLKERLIDWKEESSDDLLKGMWIIATYLYPDLELEKLRQEFEQLYYEAWLEFKPDMLPLDQVRVLNGVLFSKLKYKPNTKNFHSPSNSMINNVMESKRGNPIALCVVYLLVSQKLKLPIYGVNLPNMFILTYKSPEQQFYINAFNRGLIFSKEDIDNYINHLELTPRSIFFDPCTNEEIITRVLRNLIVSFEKLNEHYKADEVKVLLKVME